MTLKLHFHPLSSFCWKALIALYENGTHFEPLIVNHGDTASLSAFKAVWPLAKMPVLVDEARGFKVAESTIVIEYLDANYQGSSPLIPRDTDRAWQVRMWDRLFDNYIHHPMQKIVIDSLRPAGTNDSLGVDQARTQLREAYRFIEQSMETAPLMVEGSLTLADCSAAPALFYADTIEPIGQSHPNLSAYLDRLVAHQSFARVLREAEPYFEMFPLERKPKLARVAG